MTDLEAWIKERHIDEVECVVPDMSGIARGKILPSSKFLKGVEQRNLRLPEGVFVQAVTGDFPFPSDAVNPANLDIVLEPDADTIRPVPWYPEPTAQVICDAYYMEGEPVAFDQLSSRVRPLLATVTSGAVSIRAKDAVPVQITVLVMDEIRKAGLYDAIWQAFAVLLPVRTVGVMGDARTYEAVVALRAVTSNDGMTADFYPFDMAFLGRAATRIVNEVRGVNRVVYDVTSKPPGTIEWE